MVSIAKRNRFCPTEDVLLLREVLNLNPMLRAALWQSVAQGLNAACGREFTARAVRDRTLFLVKLFARGDMDKLRRLGTEEEFTERERLLQELVDIARDSSSTIETPPDTRSSTLASPDHFTDAEDSNLMSTHAAEFNVDYQPATENEDEEQPSPSIAILSFISDSQQPGPSSGRRETRQPTTSMTQLSIGNTTPQSGPSKARIGRAIAKTLSECKAHVIAVSKTISHLESLKSEHPEIEIISVDLSNWECSRTTLENVKDVHLLVNNAAVTSVKPFLEVQPEDIDRLVSVNVKAVVNVSQVVIKDMLARGQGGSIVNLSSKASMIALKNHTVYCACKSALDSITRVMALEFGPHKIRVNSINPTVVMTAMGRRAWGDPKVAAPVLSRIPLGRFADEIDVVNAVLFLLSDQSEMITGTHIPVDGGYLCS